MCPQDGSFIVRDPSKAEEKRLGFYSLSIWHSGKTRHLRYVKTFLSLISISQVFVQDKISLRQKICSW